VRLIEIASYVDGVDNGDALLQQIRRISRSLDLAKSGAGYTRCPQEMPLGGSQRKRPWLTV
jgi:hypothetical protein